MPIDHSAIAEKMEALRAPYRAWLATDMVPYLADARTHYGAPGFDEERLMFLVHRLKGTGATYGYNAISLQAAPLHDALSDGGADIQTIHTMLTGLMTACEQATQP